MAGKDLTEYGATLSKLKKKIKFSQQKAMLAVNNALLIVYWEIGSAIAEQERQAGWGKKTVDKLAADLRAEFPQMKGLSPRNLRYMRDFALAWPAFLQQGAAKPKFPENKDLLILQQAAAKLPWGHHQELLTRLKTPTERAFYVRKAVENGWSRSILVHQIESGLFKTQGALVHNFSITVPDYQSDLTQQVFKDPYNFDFIMLGEAAKERDLEDALMTHVTQMLLELGSGFAFMGRQRRFEAGDREFFIDLLFYHTKLYRHIIIELKSGEFEPEFVSKMNVYLGLADDQLRGKHDETAIGLILCKTQNRIVAEYALRDTRKPIGIAEYRIAERLPKNLRGELPSIEEIEQRMELGEGRSQTDRRMTALQKKFKGTGKHTPASFGVMWGVYQNCLRILYTELMERVNLFAEGSYSARFSWDLNRRSYSSLEEMDASWKADDNVKAAQDIHFQVRLGIKIEGTEHWYSSPRLITRFEDFHYGIVLANSNYHEPFIQKEYSKALGVRERRQVMEMFMGAVMDGVERFRKGVNRIEG